MNYSPHEVQVLGAALKVASKLVRELQTKLEIARAERSLAWLRLQQAMDAHPDIYKPRDQRSTDEWKELTG